MVLSRFVQAVSVNYRASLRPLTSVPIRPILKPPQPLLAPESLDFHCPPPVFFPPGVYFFKTHDFPKEAHFVSEEILLSPKIRAPLSSVDPRLPPSRCSRPFSVIGHCQIFFCSIYENLLGQIGHRRAPPDFPYPRDVAALFVCHPPFCLDE